MKVLVKSLFALVERDGKLFDRGVHEQAFSHRLAVYIEDFLKNELTNFSWAYVELGSVSVDCEYNRHGYEEKVLREILDTYPERKSDIVRPDIIVHIRGEKRNLMVVELTRSGMPEYNFAFSKVSAFVHSDYAYQIGVVIKLNEREGSQSPFVRIGTVFQGTVQENNTLLLAYINRALERVFDRQVRAQGFIEVGNEDSYDTYEDLLEEDDTNSFFDDFTNSEEYREQEEDYEEKRAHSDDINEMWENENEEGWPYDYKSS
jgi:hypothetical protein